MALNWNWNEKCGDLIIEVTDPETKETEERSISLYQGNAWLIMLNEFQENGVDKWVMWSFFADEDHMNNCLGLSEGYDNCMENQFVKIKRIRINKAKNRYADKIVAAFTKAFDKIEIEAFSQEVAE